jgi:hypothetical protein
MDELFEALERESEEVGVGATQREIDAAESALGVRFPQSLRAFLARFGFLVIGHHELYGLGKGVPPFLDIVRMTISEREASGLPLPANLLALENDGGGNLFTLDVRDESPNDAPVVFWHHELGPKQEPAMISPSLAQWLRGLIQ